MQSCAGESVSYPCMHWAESKLHPGKMMTDNHKAGGRSPQRCKDMQTPHKGGRSGRTRLFLLCCVRDWDLTKCTALATAQWLHMPSNKISYATLSVTTISYCTTPITGGLLWLLYLSYIRVNTPLTDVMVTTPQVRADGRNQLEDQ